MITNENIQDILLSDNFNFKKESDIYTHHYGPIEGGFDLAYNSTFGQFIYPEDIHTDRGTTQDTHQQESFVVFLCVAQLFARGYQPRNIVLEGKNYSGNDKGYCDILVVPNNKEYKDDQYLIIECKTADLVQKDDEFRKHWQKTLRNGDQLFRYFNTYRKAKYLCLFSADYPEYTKNGRIEHRFENIYNIISLEDNDEYLQTDTTLKGFKDLRESQGSADQFFNVWKDTYKQDYNTRGLLEEGIKPFEIGKKSYNLDDLKTVDEYSLEKKYNEFSLILRKHTISSHENAFDKLVNLFIAKIIDEKYHAKQLDLLWKGAAYDDYFSLQDRLNELYRAGMKEFFNDDVTFVENKKIDDAFKFLTSRADVARDTIKHYFRQLKYFNNNPFAFLDVHNEQLFYRNAVILKDVITMLQEIYLTSNTDNQFLGDLFEGFLNKGVHQSEGQYFTPIPIVRFLISSLPIQNIIESKNYTPRVIDYACGAGHFLTEYARQVKAIISAQKKCNENEDFSNYFKNIVGIEKDYRLSKVSQVAAFMYGMDGMRIHFSDGLATIPSIKDHSFDILVANPPYAVSGFLETLPEEDRQKYLLSSCIGNIEKNNAIETFFIERASQLLDSNGVATIILPSSILTKGGIYMRTRELLLEKFDLISIVCLGPSTFGQTNTSTVALFLRRKQLEPDESVQTRNRVNAWFSGNFNDDEFYKDSEFFEAYLSKMNYSRSDYEALMQGELTESFLKNEIVQEYVKALNLNGQGKNISYPALAIEAKNIRDDAQDRIKNNKAYKNYPESTKKDIETQYTVRFIQEIEKEKLYYFILAASNPQQVLIIHSPNEKSKEKKDFLGYEWSNRKGNEGIHYLNTEKRKTSSDRDDSEDELDDILTQLRGINGINTPMFNPLNLDDCEKINSLIRKNFNDTPIDIPDELNEFADYYTLTDLLTFSDISFDKGISTTATLAYPQIETKYPAEKLGKLAPYSTAKVPTKNIDKTAYICTENMQKNCQGVSFGIDTPNVEKILEYREQDILVSNIRPYLKKIWLANKSGGCSNDILVFRKDPLRKDLDVNYLHSVLTCNTFFDYMMTGKTGLRMPRGDKKSIQNFAIPLPPLEIQKLISQESLSVDQKVKEYLALLEKARTKLTKIADKFFVHANKSSLNTFCNEPMYGANSPARDGNAEVDYRYIRVTDIDDDGCLNSEWKTAREIEDKYVLKNGDMLFARSGATAGKTFLYQSNIGKAIFAGYLIKFHPNEEKLLPEFLDLLTWSTDYSEWVIKTRGGTAQPNINAQQFGSYKIPIVDLKNQKIAINEYIKQKEILFQSKKFINEAAIKKQAILDKYLK